MTTIYNLVDHLQQRTNISKVWVQVCVRVCMCLYVCLLFYTVFVFLQVCVHLLTLTSYCTSFYASFTIFSRSLNELHWLSIIVSKFVHFITNYLMRMHLVCFTTLIENLLWHFHSLIPWHFSSYDMKSCITFIIPFLHFLTDKIWLFTNFFVWFQKIRTVNLTHW